MYTDQNRIIYIHVYVTICVSYAPVPSSRPVGAFFLVERLLASYYPSSSLLRRVAINYRHHRHYYLRSKFLKKKKKKKKRKKNKSIPHKSTPSPGRRAAGVPIAVCHYQLVAAVRPAAIYPSERITTDVTLKRVVNATYKNEQHIIIIVVVHPCTV